MSAINEEQVELEFFQLKKIRQDKIQNVRRKLMERMSCRHDPFPDGAFEKLSRNNIWKTVLEHLDPASIASACSCCSTFRFLSEDSLLIHVFSVLKNKGWLYLKHIRKADPLHTRSRFLNNHNIWQLRLVSKSWKRVTEQVHINEFGDPSWYFNYPDLWCTQSVYPVLSDRPEEMERASHILESSDFRTMLWQLFIFGSGIDINWFSKTCDFLKKHGALIQRVYLHCTRAAPTPLDRYKVLWNYLQWLPNLKCLIVDNGCGSSDVDMDNTQLRDFIKEVPLPTIQSLRMIHFESEYKNELILNELLRANTHVKCLRLPRKTPVTEMVQLQMEKLTGLEEYRTRAGSEESLTQLTTILRDTKWPLKHLKIGVVYGRVFGTTDELFNLVNRFAPTLETLGWILHPSKVDFHHRLELPKLKKISFDFYAWQPAVGLDFLLPCKSLEQIHFVDLSTDGYAGASVDSVLIGYESTVEESNFWKWFPRLVCVRFEEFTGFLQKETKCTPTHYVRKGSGIVKVPLAWNCEIKCKKYEQS